MSADIQSYNLRGYDRGDGVYLSWDDIDDMLAGVAEEVDDEEYKHSVQTLRNVLEKAMMTAKKSSPPPLVLPLFGNYKFTVPHENLLLFTILLSFFCGATIVVIIDLVYAILTT